MKQILQSSDDPSSALPRLVDLVGQSSKAEWFLELAFERMKSIMGSGHLAKGNENSAKAWIHGKLFVAFLAEALIEDGRLFPPWGSPV